MKQAVPFSPAMLILFLDNVNGARWCSFSDNSGLRYLSSFPLKGRPAYK